MEKTKETGDLRDTRTVRRTRRCHKHTLANIGMCMYVTDTDHFVWKVVVK